MTQKTGNDCGNSLYLVCYQLMRTFQILTGNAGLVRRYMVKGIGVKRLTKTLIISTIYQNDGGN